MSEHTTPPDADAIVTLAERALAEIPASLREHVRGVAIAVEEFADDETLDIMGIESEWELTGLYTGTPIGQQSVSDIARPPAMINLYRQPILLEWVETGEDLGRLVRNVVIHEIAHHFGFSEEEIEALERD
jgi:predicted Zn-dependent protease with MMP-like domain